MFWKMSYKCYKNLWKKRPGLIKTKKRRKIKKTQNKDPLGDA